MMKSQSQQVSDEEILRGIAEVLNTADFSTATMSGIREVLEQKLGADLSEKKGFIRSEVDKYLADHTDLGPMVKAEEDGGAVAAQELQQPAVDNDPELEKFRENIEQAIEESAPKEKKRRGGLNKLCRLSPDLQAIIGEEALPRTQVVKQLWVYIRTHNLQDPENKRNIICNDALKQLFGQDSTDMFQMNKLLSKHIWSMNEETGLEDSEPKAKKQKKESGKISGALPISDALQKFFGTGESEATRSEVVKRLWDYIRTNQLQDPTDKRKILCDTKLQELFECDSFVGFSMSKLLVTHFVKR